MLLKHIIFLWKLPDLLVIMFKALHTLLPMNVHKNPEYSVYESVHSTRHKCKFKHNYACTSLKIKSISIKVANCLNSLSGSLITCRNVHQSKKYYAAKLENDYVLKS